MSLSLPLTGRPSGRHAPKAARLFHATHGGVNFEYLLVTAAVALGAAGAVSALGQDAVSPAFATVGDELACWVQQTGCATPDRKAREAFDAAPPRGVSGRSTDAVAAPVREGTPDPLTPYLARGPSGSELYCVGEKCMPVSRGEDGRWYRGAYVDENGVFQPSTGGALPTPVSYDAKSVSLDQGKHISVKDMVTTSVSGGAISSEARDKFIRPPRWEAQPYPDNADHWLAYEESLRPRFRRAPDDHIRRVTTTVGRLGSLGPSNERLGRTGFYFRDGGRTFFVTAGAIGGADRVLAIYGRFGAPTGVLDPTPGLRLVREARHPGDLSVLEIQGALPTEARPWTVDDIREQPSQQHQRRRGAAPTPETTTIKVGAPLGAPKFDSEGHLVGVALTSDLEISAVELRRILSNLP